jgi:hypothetical protein
MMIRHKGNLYVAAGSFALALGLSLRVWTHGNYSHFATGFLVGISLALLVFGPRRRSRGSSN